MGLIDVNGAFPNFTKCSTWQDIKKSHAAPKLVELLLHDVYGMLILLSIGLTISILALAVEKAVRKKFKSQAHDLASTNGTKSAGPGHEEDISPSRARVPDQDVFEEEFELE